MPCSALEGKEFIKQWFDKQGIEIVLDVGVGQGTYRDLLGDKYKWIGIEVFAPYVEMFGLNKKYDQLIIGDVRIIELPDADCIICGDILEHMLKEDVIKFLEKTKKFKHMVVSLPLGSWPQGEVNGNSYETHLSEWTMREAEEIFNFPIKRQEGHMGIFIR